MNRMIIWHIHYIYGNTVYATSPSTAPGTTVTLTASGLSQYTSYSVKVRATETASRKIMGWEGCRKHKDLLLRSAGTALTRTTAVEVLLVRNQDSPWNHVRVHGFIKLWAITPIVIQVIAKSAGKSTSEYYVYRCSYLGSHERRDDLCSYHSKYYEGQACTKGLYRACSGCGSTNEYRHDKVPCSHGKTTAHCPHGKYQSHTVNCEHGNAGRHD